MPILRAAAHTDIGLVRTQNEDRWLCDPAHGLFGVADGVGGLPGGAEAAQAAVEALARFAAGVTSAEEAAWVDVVHRANAAVRAEGLRVSPDTGIATTLTAGAVRGDTLHLVHVGDSRAYGWRDGVLTPLTEDHSLENEARRQARRGRFLDVPPHHRQMLTRCLGQLQAPEVDVHARPLLAGDRYLFCTDGVTRLLPDGELATLLGGSGDPVLLARTLVELAVRRGGPDNATAVVLVVDAAP